MAARELILKLSELQSLIKVPVIIHHAEGEKTVTVNQKQKPTEKHNLLPLGTFRFESGKNGWLEIRNEGTTGHVIIDAAQWVPVK